MQEQKQQQQRGNKQQAIPRTTAVMTSSLRHVASALKVGQMPLQHVWTKRHARVSHPRECDEREGAECGQGATGWHGATQGHIQRGHASEAWAARQGAEEPAAALQKHEHGQTLPSPFWFFSPRQK